MAGDETQKCVKNVLKGEEEEVAASFYEKLND